MRLSRLSGNHEGQNVCVPYENRPNRGRRMRFYAVVERNESVYVWHDIEGREPFFDVPDIFAASFDDGSSLADYYPRQTLYEPAQERLHSTRPHHASANRPPTTRATGTFKMP